MRVPHRKSYVIDRDKLLAFVDHDELGVAKDRELPAASQKVDQRYRFRVGQGAEEISDLAELRKIEEQDIFLTNIENGLGNLDDNIRLAGTWGAKDSHPRSAARECGRGGRVCRLWRTGIRGLDRASRRRQPAPASPSAPRRSLPRLRFSGRLGCRRTGGLGGPSRRPPGRPGRSPAAGRVGRAGPAGGRRPAPFARICGARNGLTGRHLRA